MFRLYEEGLYSDVTFIIDERTFSLHRCVLAARSAFFHEALGTRWKGKRCIHLAKAKVSVMFERKRRLLLSFSSSMLKVSKLSFDICTLIVVKSRWTMLIVL